MKKQPIRLHMDIQVILKGFFLIFCAGFLIKMKTDGFFVEFDSRIPYLNGVLHHSVFKFLLDKVNQYSADVCLLLLILGTLLLLISCVCDYYRHNMAYRLYLAGMVTLSLDGILFLGMNILFGFGKLAMEPGDYFFLMILAMVIATTVFNLVLYIKRKEEMEKSNKVLVGLVVVLVAAAFAGSGIYFWKNVGADFMVCNEVNRYLEGHPEEVNEEIAYQIGNVASRGAFYTDGAIYYTGGGGRTIYRLNEEGEVEVFYSVPGGVYFCQGIFGYDGYLYVECDNFMGTSMCSIVQISIADRTANVIYSSEDRFYFGVADGKLLYETRFADTSDEDSVREIYCLDLSASYDVNDAVLYDINVDGHILDQELWIQKYLYGYTDTFLQIVEYTQFMDGNVYYLHDFLRSEMGYGGKDPDKFSYNANCTLVRMPGEDTHILEGVTSFSVFDGSIYFTRETENGYEVCSCDKDGGNVTSIAFVPVAFIEDNHGYTVGLSMGDGFALCVVYASHDGEYGYFIDIENGTVTEVEFE